VAHYKMLSVTVLCMNAVMTDGLERIWGGGKCRGVIGAPFSHSPEGTEKNE
jgi:hypothetical protein